MEYKIFWCKVNKYYINKWLNYFNNQNFDIENKILVASCVVTDRAKSKWLKDVKNYLNDWKIVYLTWCWAFEKWDQMDYDKFYKIYPELEKYLDKLILLWENPNNQFKNINDHSIEISDDNDIYTKKFIVIQNWCDTFCTFCLTILKRWKSSSVNLENILEEINQFVYRWWKEIVITGINLAAWWCTNTRKPEQSKIAFLLQQILSKTEIERIRLSSLWPEFLNDDFFKIIENPRFMPHFHISVQSFSDNVLKNMNRNYDSKLVYDVINRLKNLNREDKDFISIWADIIIWFPWESEENFIETYDWIKNLWITKLHLFPFSAHDKWETVPAWSFDDQINSSLKKIREKKLLELWDSIRKKFIEFNKWKIWKVLIENKFKDNWIYKWSGWTSNYLQVEIEWDYKRWEIIDFKF